MQTCRPFPAAAAQSFVFRSRGTEVEQACGKVAREEAMEMAETVPFTERCCPGERARASAGGRGQPVIRELASQV